MSPPGDRTPLQLRFDAFDLDEGESRLSQNGQPVALPPKAFAVLCALARQPGHLITKSELLDAVWGHQYVSESVLKTTISELRAALADDARQPRYIETAARRGYRFIATPAPPGPAGALPAGGLPLESPAPVAELPALIGRQTALARLAAAWEAAGSGRRQIFLLAGEAGIGKTTLIDRFAAEVGLASCAHGQCVEQFGAGEPYLPVLEALGNLCRHAPTLAALLRAVAPTWLLQLPWLTGEAEREALRRELAGASQDCMLRELGEFLERYTRERPLLLITEDLHWSDQATVQLIDHIARRRAPARLLWLASFRLAEVVAEGHPLTDLRHELRLHRLCDEIVLDPFSEQEVADYIDERFPQLGASETFVRALHARTDGLPLFLANVVEDLDAQGVLQPGTGGVTGEAASLPLQVPASLAGVIEKQIGRLSAEQRGVLEAASVCGVEFRPATVADALGSDPGRIGACCDELARQQQWLGSATVDCRADGVLEARYAFRHALYRQVFYERLGILARAQLHQRVALALEGGRAAGMAVTAAELASHYERSHNPLAALRYYAEAAENALRHFAPREAMSLTGHALAMLGTVPTAPAVPASTTASAAPAPAGRPPGAARDALELTLSALRGVAAAQLLGVSSLAAKQAFERAQVLLDALPQHPLRGLVLHALGLVLMVRGEYAEGLALGERTRALSAALDDRVLLASACNVLGQISTLQGRPVVSRRWLEQGAATCEELGDEVLQAAFVVDPGVTIVASLVMPLLHLGLVDQARARLEQAVARADRLGQPMGQMIATWFGALFEVRMGNVERVAALAEHLREIVDAAALAQGEAACRWFRGWAEARLESPRTGYRRIREAFDHNARLGMFSGGTEVLCYAAEALLLAGAPEDAQVQLEEAKQLARRLEERVYLPQLLLLQARIADARGDAPGARGARLAALQEARAQQALWLELSVLVALCAGEDVAADDLEALAQACARLSEGFATELVRRAHDLLRAHQRPVPPRP